MQCTNHLNVYNDTTLLLSHFTTSNGHIPKVQLSILNMYLHGPDAAVSSNVLSTRILTLNNSPQLLILYGVSRWCWFYT